MRKLRLGFAVYAALTTVALAQQPALPVKGIAPIQLNASGKGTAPVAVDLRLFDREFGGTLLFQEQQKVSVEADGVFVAMVGQATKGGVPVRITNQYATVWAEYSLAGSAGINMAQARQPITHTRPDVSVNLVPDGGQIISLCFTCGGNWPYFSGSFTNTGTGPTERLNSCSSTLIIRTDSRPFLCSR